MKEYRTDWRFTCPKCSHLNTNENKKCKNCDSTPILARHWRGGIYRLGCNNCEEWAVTGMTSCTQCGAHCANRFEVKGLFGWRKASC